MSILNALQRNSPGIISHAFKAGARGFLAKVDLGYDLIPAVEAVSQRKPFLSRSILHSGPTNLGLPVDGDESFERKRRTLETKATEPVLTVELLKNSSRP